MSCDRVAKEAEKVADVCQRAMESLPIRSSERNEIFNFFELVNTRKPSYTAAGYFIINRGTLFGLLSVTTTYFIVMLQFNQSL